MTIAIPTAEDVARALASAQLPEDPRRSASIKINARWHLMRLSAPLHRPVFDGEADDMTARTLEPAHAAPAPAAPCCAGCAHFRAMAPMLDPGAGVSVRLGECRRQGCLFGAEDSCPHHTPRA